VISFACRDGGRHPGRVKGATLRGVTSEAGPRSVRRVLRASSREAGAPMTAGVRRSPRRGTSSACANQAPAPAHARVIVACARKNASFARSFDPCTSILTSHAAPKARRGGATDSVSRLGKPTRVGRTSTGAGRTGVARLAACHRSREGEAWHVRRGRRSRPPSPRGSASPGWVARTSCSVADVGRRQLASNKLGTRAPKRAVRVE
jgi:hypothetical protein